jgi:hypothetical protein
LIYILVYNIREWNSPFINHTAYPLPLDPEKCVDIFQRMRNELPECPELDG